MTSKDKKELKLLEFLENTTEDWPDRQTLGQEVLGYKNGQSIWNVFTAEDLDRIEQNALERRRAKFARFSAVIDQSLIEKALGGDTAAMKLYYQRFEGWSDKLGLTIEKVTVEPLLDGLDDIYESLTEE